LDACHFDNSCTFLEVSIYFDYNVCFDLCYFALAAYNCFDFPLKFYNWAYCAGESFAVNYSVVENWMGDPDTV
jgi:hypothetical protein